MRGADTHGPRPWWLAVGLGAAAGVMAGLSLARLPCLAAAGALVGVTALRSRPRFGGLAAGVACLVSTVLTLDPDAGIFVRLALALSYGAAAAASVLALRWFGGRVTLVGPTVAAVVAIGLVAAPATALHRDLDPVVVAQRSAELLDVGAAQTYLAGEVRDGRLPGLVFAVAENGEPVRYTAFGTTGSGGEEVRPTTRFRIWSMSKSFTALAMMRLVEEGRVDLKAPVADYLDWFDVRYPPGRQVVTVADLLHHDSGIPNSAGWEHLAGGGSDPLGDMKQGLAGTALLPTGEIEYANANYILVAQIIEEVTGQTFADYLTAEVLDPLGLDSTTARRPTGDDLAEGHRMWFGAPVLSTAPFLDVAVPAGFMTSNAPDLLSYLDQVVRSDNPVVPPTIRRALLDGEVDAPHSSAGEAFPLQRYGKGWVRGPIAGNEVVWHSGGLADFNTVMVSHPEGDWSFVILTNTASQVSSLMPALTENVTAHLTGSGTQRAGAGTTLTNSYILFDLVLIAAALLLTWGASKLARRGQNQASRRDILVVGTSSTAVLAALAFSVPAVTGFPAEPLSPGDHQRLARVLTTYVPDVGWSLLLLAAACTALAGASVVLAIQRRTSVTRSSPSERAAV